MKVLSYEPDKELYCRFRGHEFHLERCTESYGFGNWYMIVKDETGAYACDGWIDDSSSIGVMNAMEQACDGAMIEPPKRWPKELKAN